MIRVWLGKAGVALTASLREPHLLSLEGASKRVMIQIVLMRLLKSVAIQPAPATMQAPESKAGSRTIWLAFYSEITTNRILSSQRRNKQRYMHLPNSLSNAVNIHPHNKNIYIDCQFGKANLKRLSTESFSSPAKIKGSNYLYSWVFRFPSLWTLIWNNHHGVRYSCLHLKQAS